MKSTKATLILVVFMLEMILNNHQYDSAKLFSYLGAHMANFIVVEQFQSGPMYILSGHDHLEGYNTSVAENLLPGVRNMQESDKPDHVIKVQTVSKIAAKPFNVFHAWNIHHCWHHQAC